MTYNVFSGTLNPTQSINSVFCCHWSVTSSTMTFGLSWLSTSCCCNSSASQIGIWFTYSYITLQIWWTSGFRLGPLAGHMSGLISWGVSQHTSSTVSWAWGVDALSCRKTNTSLKPRLHDTPCCQTGCQTGLTTGCIVYTAGCQTGCQAHCTTRFDNRLKFNELWLFVQHGCQTGCTNGLTTSCIV